MKSINIVEIFKQININGDNKILFAVYDDKINLSLNYSLIVDDEQFLKLYTFLKFFIK